MAKEASRAIDSASFSQRREEFIACLDDILDLLSDPAMYSEYEADRAKAFLPGKRMLFEEDLLALWP